MNYQRNLNFNIQLLKRAGEAAAGPGNGHQRKGRSPPRASGGAGEEAPVRKAAHSIPCA